MPFGLINAPAFFPRAFDVIVTKYKWETYLVYLNDIIILSNSIEERIGHEDHI